MKTRIKTLLQNRFFQPGNLLKVILAFLLTFFVFSKTDLEAIYALRTKVVINWVLLAFSLFFLMTVLKTFQYFLFLKQDIGYFQILNIMVIQNTVSNFVATGAGIVSYFALSRLEQGVKISRSGVAFILTKVSDVIAIWIFLLISSTIIWKKIIPIQGFVIGLLTAIGIAILIVILSIMLRQKFSIQLRRWIDKLKLGNQKYVRLSLDVFDEIIEQNDVFSLHVLSQATLYSIIYLLTTMGWFYANMRSFDMHISVVAVVFVNVFVQLLSNIPIQAFGGLGVFESVSLYLYQFFYSGQQELASALIGIRILYYLMNLATLIYIPIHKLLVSKPPQEI